jgi:DMSO/TMAO reductase YedYZ molybdopterin-dependent catalytic subunit
VRTAPRGLLAVAGAVAGLAGIAVSQLLAAALHARATPIQVVAEQVVEQTPGPVAERLIHLVGRNDKPLLIAGVTLAILLLGAVAGVLSARSRVLANVLFVVMGVVALLAASSGGGLSPATLVAVGGGVAAWLVALNLLADRVGRVAADRAEDGSRRAFLLTAGVVAAGAVALAGGAQLVGRGRRAVEASRRRLRLPVDAGEVPAGARSATPGVPPWRTPNADFYRIDTALVLPAVDPADWRLRIHGMVDREVSLDYHDLLARVLTQAWVTLCCVSNEVGGDLIGNAWWSGVRVAGLLAEAGVDPRADAVKQTSKNGWTCGTPLEVLTDDRQAMLAVAMNGRPLPVEHGFPVRMVVPGLYGYVSATKWVVDLEVTRFDRFDAYWTERGWSELGPVKTQSRIDVPRTGADVSAGSIRIGGCAWAQHTGIELVEVQLDGGPWQAVDLGRVPSVDTWVQWSGRLEAPPGEHRLAVRATDRSGYTQTAVRAGVVPNGATGWHTIDFTAT